LQAASFLTQVRFKTVTCYWLAVILRAAFLFRTTAIPEVNTVQPDQTQLRQLESQLAAEYQTILSKKLNLDLTRGKPSSDKLDLLF
jgi:hypothetical protein